MKEVKDFLSSRGIKSKSSISSMTYGKMTKLIGEIDDLIYEIQKRDGLRLRDTEVMEQLPSYKALVQKRNKIQFDNLLKSSVYKNEVRDQCRQTFYDKRIPSVDEWVDYEIPFETCDKIVQRILKSYVPYPPGIWIAIFSKTGKPQQLNLDDTADCEHFTQAMIDVAAKKRKGGSPQLSATLFKPETLIYGTDGTAYKVTLDKNNRKKWTQHLIEGKPIIAPKKKMKNKRGGPPSSPSELFEEGTVKWGLDGRLYRASKNKWVCLT